MERCSQKAIPPVSVQDRLQPRPNGCGHVILPNADKDIRKARVIPAPASTRSMKFAPCLASRSSKRVRRDPGQEQKQPAEAWKSHLWSKNQRKWGQ